MFSTLLVSFFSLHFFLFIAFFHFSRYTTTTTNIYTYNKMNVFVSSDQLQKVLPFVSHAVSPRMQLPVLGNILFEGKQEKLICSATDLEIGIEATVQAEVKKEGGVTVPAKIFNDFINTLPAGQIQLEMINTSLQVTTEKIRSSFQTVAKEEFPKLYEEQGEQALIINGESMHQHFPRVVFAASQDVGRPALSGVLIKKEGKNIVLVATDGYRLSLKRFLQEKKEDEGSERHILIPARVIREILGVKEEGSLSLFLSQKNNQIMFMKEGVRVVGRLIDAEFPDYTKILPTHFETRVAFDKEELYRAVKTSAIFARDSAHIVRFTLKKGSIEVFASSPSVGQNMVEVEAETSGEENEIAFNARYLLDMFSHIEEDDMVFEMTGPLNPGVFKVKDDDSFLHLVMPIRVQAQQT